MNSELLAYCTKCKYKMVVFQDTHQDKKYNICPCGHKIVCDMGAYIKEKKSISKEKKDYTISLEITDMESVRGTCGKCNTEQLLKIRKVGKKKEDYCFWCPKCEDQISREICTITPWYSENATKEGDSLRF